MKIDVLNQAGGGVGEYRVTTPHTFLSDKGHKVNFINNINEPLSGDIVFIHISIIVNSNEEHYLNMFNYIKHIKNQGIKVIIDIDDYWVLPTWHNLYGLTKVGKMAATPYNIRHINVFNLADHVTTSTDFLYKEIKKHIKHVTVLPNSLHDTFISNKKSDLNNDRLKITWGGSSTHMSDIKLIDRSGIMSKMDKINGQFILAGFNTMIKMPDGQIVDSPDQSEWPKYEKIITNNYNFLDKNYKNYLLKYDKTSYHTTNVSYIRRWARDVKNYLSVFSDVDIVLAPLVNDSFNKAKSELKLIEAGWNKKPVICSNMPQYKKVIDLGGGFTFENNVVHKEIMKHIMYYKENPNKMLDDGLKLYEICNDKFNIYKVTEKREHLYQSLI